jgi:alpha-ribazole phosphatase
MWYIIRHGETSHNKLHIKQGRYPSILNAKGIEQSKAIANKLAELEGKELKNFKFVTSPLLRTRQTIEIIMRILNIKKAPICEDLLVSKDKGIFENLSKDFIEKNFPEEIEKAKLDSWNYAPPHGESFAVLFERVKKFLKKYKKEQNLVIVLHGGASPLLRGLLLNDDDETIKKNKISQKQNEFYIWNGKKVERVKIQLGEGGN